MREVPYERGVVRRTKACAAVRLLHPASTAFSAFCLFSPLITGKEAFLYEKQKIRDINLIEVDSILINRLESDLYREAMDILYQQYGCFYLIGIPLFNREKNIIVVNTFNNFDSFVNPPKTPTV